MSEETIERIETKIAFLERANVDLSDVVYRQRQEIDELRTRLLDITRSLEALKVEQAQDSSEERPPHY